ncbi:MAG: type 1 glutamine amidotransferase [Methylococcales bacterium]|nr:type 1 glutamine amidotransferase [Methylococcales bacterium]
MAEKPRVAVTGNSRLWAPAWWCTAVAIRLAGAVPERISTRHAYSGKPLAAVIIGGGNDIGPEHYQGDLDAAVKTDPERDLLEIHWIQKALREQLPLLGICRGAQLINVVLGGTLHQDIRHLRNLTSNRGTLLPSKTVRLAHGSRLAGICRSTQLNVNSLHHQAISRAGSGISPVGWDLDQLIQAIERPTGQSFLLGVQWHPEYLLYLSSQRAIFKALIHSRSC